VVKPADFSLRVKSLSAAGNSGVRIEALSVDLQKFRESKELSAAGLQIEEERKRNPRILIRGVPCDLTREEIISETIALNLKGLEAPELKMVYIFSPKRDRITTNCVLEVSPDVRSRLLSDGLVCIGYSACRVTDYIRVLQCFRCLAFGHLAKNCKFPSLCGHCAGEHETKDCTKRDATPVCGNCKRWTGQDMLHHSALDSACCPILQRRMAERSKSINYG